MHSEQMPSTSTFKTTTVGAQFLILPLCVKNKIWCVIYSAYKLQQILVPNQLFTNSQLVNIVISNTGIKSCIISFRKTANSCITCFPIRQQNIVSVQVYESGLTITIICFCNVSVSANLQKINSTNCAWLKCYTINTTLKSIVTFEFAAL